MTKFDAQKKEVIDLLLINLSPDIELALQKTLSKEVVFNYNLTSVSSFKKSQLLPNNFKEHIQIIIIDLDISNSDEVFKKIHDVSPIIPIIALVNIVSDNQKISFVKKGLGAYLIKGQYRFQEINNLIHNVVIIYRNIMKVKDCCYFKQRMLSAIQNSQEEGSLNLNTISNVMDESNLQYLLEKIEFHNQKYRDISTKDTLTSVYNRIEFESRIEQVLSLSDRQKACFAIFFIDIDGFKDINDAYGHEVGDKVLQHLAMIWKDESRKGDVWGRIGGDEFGLISFGIKTLNDASVIAERIINSLKEPLEIGDVSIRVSVSIGVNCCHDNSSSAKSLLNKADAAMYRAKKTMGSSFEYYSEVLRKSHLRRQTILKLLNSSLKNEEFYLVYQPIISLKDNCIVGVEVLLRWNNRLLMDVGPEEFIPLVEESGLIVAVGDWVMEQALHQYSKWKKKFSLKFDININFSIKQLFIDGISGKVERLLKKYQIDPSCLILELTETVVMIDLESSKKYLREFNKFGVKFSIDDFGTGYSSMLHLKLLPIFELKIDKSFVRDINIAQSDTAIVSSILSLSKGLGIEVVAEGIETKEQLDYLVKNGCEKGQGYYFSKPKTADEMLVYLNNYNDDKNKK
ncbi:MAG: bifunctional diguanylate cyclase/phosphodiesterase [Legionellaceae bacterium]|nr:bifunctional diguanylate cyclase/phosphodiesterase [Legionellaceae bacterium]